MLMHARAHHGDNPFTFAALRTGGSAVTKDKAEEKEGDSALTRRNFLLRSGQIGWMFSVLGSPFSGLAAPARRQFAELLHAATRPSAAALPANLLSGFQWRTLGPFRGGRVA